MNAEVINITEKAVEQIRVVMQKENSPLDHGLRLAVTGGGCSGLSYKIELKERDNVITINGIKIFIDPKSSIYLKDTVLDFEDGLNGKGFVFKNPNATNTCGCGESFSV